MTNILTPTGWKEIEEEYGTFHENIDEAYHPEPPKRYDFPIEVESLVKERAKKHIDSLNSDPNSEHYYTHRFHYKGPRTKVPTPIGRGSRPASTPKANATGFSIAIYRRSKKHKYPKGYKGGEHVGYVLPGDIGVQPHATKHAELPRRRMWESVSESTDDDVEKIYAKNTWGSVSEDKEVDSFPTSGIVHRSKHKVDGQDVEIVHHTHPKTGKKSTFYRNSHPDDTDRAPVFQIPGKHYPVEKLKNELSDEAFEKAMHDSIRDVWGEKALKAHKKLHGLKESQTYVQQQRAERAAAAKNSRAPGYDELEDVADQIIHDILPDLKRSLDAVGEEDLHGAVTSHLNDRLFDEYPNSNRALRHKAVDTVVNRYVHKTKKSKPRRKLVTPHPLPLKPKLPRKRKEKEQAWNKAGFKSKTDKPPIAGRSSYGKAKYALEEDHSPLRKIVSLMEARKKKD